jgi:hypothetical protein
MENDGIQKRYGNDDESKWIFKQQIEQSHGLYHRQYSVKGRNWGLSRMGQKFGSVPGFF